MRLAIVKLQVRDWSAMVTFYQTALGLRELALEPEDQYAWLDAGGIILALHGSTAMPAGPGDRATLQFEVDDVLEAIETLEGRGCMCTERQLATGEAYRLGHFRDPEGNAFSVYDMKGR